MKKYLAVSGIFAALFFSACSSSTTTSVAGYVKDSNGRAVEGAEISLAPASSLTDPKAATAQVRSSVNGSYQIMVRHDSSEAVFLTIRKPGSRSVHSQTFTRDNPPKGSNDIILD